MKKIVASKASSNFIRYIAYKYHSNESSTFEGIAADVGITAKMVSKLLFRGIAEDIVSDRVADKIFVKVVYCYKSGQYQRAMRWEKAFDLRNEKRYNERQHQKQVRIAELEHLIETYDDYAIEEKDAPTKEQLIQELNRIKGLRY